MFTISYVISFLDFDRNKLIANYYKFEVTATIRNLRCQQQLLREAWKLKVIIAMGVIIFEGAFTVRLLGVRWLGVDWGITKINLQ